MKKRKETMWLVLILVMMMAVFAVAIQAQTGQESRVEMIAITQAEIQVVPPLIATTGSFTHTDTMAIADATAKTKVIDVRKLPTISGMQIVT